MIKHTPATLGSLVILDRFAADVLKEDFPITKNPVPAYAGVIVGHFGKGDVGFVIEVYRVVSLEDLTYTYVYLRILSPRGIGWIDERYIENVV